MGFASLYSSRETLRPEIQKTKGLPKDQKQLLLPIQDRYGLNGNN